MARKAAKEKPKASPAEAPAKRAFSTRAATGRSLHAVAIDCRTTWARRSREVFSAVVSDLGGQDLQSELSLQTIRRVTGLTILAEQMEAKLAQDEEIDVNQYVTVINSFNRTAGALGLARQSKDITPNLEQYLASKAAERPAEPEDTDELEDAENG